MSSTMHGRETISRDHSISDLLEMINNGQLVLPEFQRDFDWGEDRVSQLLATIAKKWPIGSLLLQEFPGETFYKLRSLEGGPDVINDTVRYVALDGQQRLTSLYQALFDAGDSIFAVRTDALQEKPNVSDLEEAIKAFDKKEWTSREASEVTPWEWIPFSVLKNPVDFFMWRDRILARTTESDRLRVGDLLSNAYKNGLEAFNTYRIPSTIVESGLEPEAVARIFERVNRGGIPLGAFDLMVARTFEPEWNLRDKWEEACEAYPKLRLFFGEDGIPIIRVIALEHARNVREGSVLSLGAGIVRGRWQQAVESMAGALDFLEEHCGVYSPSVLPYGGFHTVLAAVALKHDLFESSPILTRWYFSTAFGLGFEGAVNTVVVEEYDRLLDALGGAPLSFRPMVTLEYFMGCTRKKKGALWKAFINVLSVGEPRDLISGEDLHEDRVIVSLFPESSVIPEFDEPQNQLILGNVMADQETYRDLTKGGVEYLDEIRGKNLDVDRFDALCASQLVPDISIAVSNRVRWIELRAEMVNQRIAQIVGESLK